MSHNKRFLKNIFCLLLSFIVFFQLSGCFNLGGWGDNDMEEGEKVTEKNFAEYYKPYYDSFGDIKLLDQGVTTSYDLMDSFFNHTTVNKFKWEDESYEVESKAYSYFAVEIKKDVTIKSMSMFVKLSTVLENTSTKNENPSTTAFNSDSGTLKIYAFLLDSESLSDYCTADKYEKNNIQLDNCDDPKVEDSIGQATCKMDKDSWTSFTIQFYKKGSNTLNRTKDVASGEYLVLRFENNTGFGVKDGLNMMVFTMTNFLVAVPD